MASKNEVKLYAPDAHYHVYNRGVNGMRIFEDETDYRVFLNLLKRHLSLKPVKDKRGREYSWLANDVELEAFCLMPNHFHLLLYQIDQNALPKLMRAVITPYVGYFNKKYSRFGPLFQGVYKASLIYTDSYLDHISRYIHLNPAQYKTYKWSSYDYFLDKNHAEWLRPARIRDMFKSVQEYAEFVADYEDYKVMLDEIKHELADHKSYL